MILKIVYFFYQYTRTRSMYSWS